MLVSPTALAAVACAIAIATAGCGATATTTSVGPTPEKCGITLPSTTRAIGAPGGAVSINVSTEPECTWSVTTQANWIAGISPAFGQGPAQVTAQVAANAGPARSGAVLIEGIPFTVSQAEGCSYVVDPLLHPFGTGGGASTVSVTTADGCSWGVTNPSQWVSITTAASGTGSGSVGFSVDANNGPERTATLTIAGRAVTISQASGCTYSVVSPSTVLVDFAGGTRTADVRTGPGCRWTAVSHDPWIGIVAGREAFGEGSAAYMVAPFPSIFGGRAGSVTVAGVTITVIQGD